MNISLAKWFVGSILACACWSPLQPAQASESNEALSVTLDRTAQFPAPGGEDVLVPAGTYTVTAGNDQFILKGSAPTPITIVTTEWSHTKDVPVPTVLFLSSEEGQVPQRHLLVLYYPDGKTVQAMGTDPVVASRGIEDLPSEYVVDPALVTFEQPVYFTAPDGTSVVVDSGTYTAEASEQAIRLLPSGESQQALLIEARQDTHDTPLEVLLALSLPGTTPKELDLHYLMLLLPGGQSLEATGSYSGIQTRGFLRGAFKQAKKGINTVGGGIKKGANVVGGGVVSGVVKGGQFVGSGAQQGVKIIGSGGKQVISAGTKVAVQAGKGIEQGAKLAWDGTKWVVRQVEDKATMAVCYAVVGGMKGGKALGQVMGKMVPTALSNRAGMVSKFAADAAFKNDIDKKITQAIDANKNAIPEMQRIQGWMANKVNRPKLESIFSVDNFCRDSIRTMDDKLRQLGLAPNLAALQSQVAVPAQPQVREPVQPQVMPQVIPQITMAMVSGAYRHNPVQNNWHMGFIVPDGAGLRWTNKAGASWHLIPDLVNQRLQTGPDNPYFAQGLREFKLMVSNGQIVGFEFAGGTYLRESEPVPSQPTIQSRGLFGEESGPHTFVGYSVTVDASYVVGAVIGVYGVTDFRGNGGKYWFLGAQGGITAGAGGVLQVIYFPRVELESFEGGEWGIGGSLGKGAVVALDAIFDEHFKKFQGFGIGGGGGVGPTKLVGDLAVSWDYSWKY